MFMKRPAGSPLYLDSHRNGSAATETERCQTATATATAQFINERCQHAGATGADGMSKRDSSAVDIDTRPVPIEFFAVRQRLRGKRFVDLNQVEVADLHAGALQKAIDGTGGSGKDVARLDGG